MSTTTRLDCPTWCERPGHDADDAGGPSYHYGPDFGPYIGVMGVGHPLGLTTGEWSEMTAGDLRDLAGAALLAAEWLEANQ